MATEDFARSGSLATDTVILPKGQACGTVCTFRVHLSPPCPDFVLVSSGTDALASLPHSIEVGAWVLPETTIMGYIGTIGLYWGYIGIMEKNMETTWVLGDRAGLTNG